MDVLARLAADDRVVDARGTVDEVERCVEPLLGQAHLRRVGALVGDPAGVDAVMRIPSSARSSLALVRVSMLTAALAMFVCG